MRAAPTKQAPVPASKNENLRRKRLGQYYTGSRLANLLAELADAKRATSVLDPMAGTGDMLVASAGPNKTLAAIEIDPIAASTCRKRIQSLVARNATTVFGNAFSTETLRKLPLLEWDLVVTNPPYVRYQEGGLRTSINELDLPSAAEVRVGLIEAIDILPGLDPADRGAVRRLAENYSGLADLAVPSWILCAGLVRRGGTLAMVVPNAWLSRDYAAPIHHLLARWFDTEVVVEDADAAWFSDALVRTTLVVAHRSESASDYPHIKVHKEAADARSLVGSAYKSSNHPDGDFAQDTRRWRADRRIAGRPFITGHWVSAAQLARRVRRGVEGPAIKESVPIPFPLTGVMAGATRLATLEGIGWRVGQGLRTGANQFFYVDQLSRGHETEIVSTSQLFGGKTISVPSRGMLPVLRRQSELPAGYVIDASALRGRVLLLSDLVLPEDAVSLFGSIHSMPSELAEYVRSAARLDVGTAEAPRFIPQLSAVAPNQRQARAGQPPRFWYQLPNLTDRHRPDLAVARINHGFPKTFLNPVRRAVIDANFSTMWRVDEGAPDEFALFAALNSSWSRSLLELSSTVLGGGALKVEATHLRRLPLPSLDAGEWPQLSQLGRELSTEPTISQDSVFEAIDAAIGMAFFPAIGTHNRLSHVKEIAALHLRSRTRK